MSGYYNMLGPNGKIKEALYYVLQGDETVQCMLCPHKCVLEEGRTGLCGTRRCEKIKSKKPRLYSLNYERITKTALEPIEKHGLCEFHKGSNILTLGSFGCNLKCSFCENHEISQNLADNRTVTSDEAIEMIDSFKDENNIGIAFAYNEPLVSYEYILEVSKKLKEKSKDKKIVLVTNGFINEEPLKELLPYIDALNIDLKGDEIFYAYICKGILQPVLNTIRISVEMGCHVEITTPLIEGENTSLDSVKLIRDYLKSIDGNIPLHITRCVPNYKMDKEATSIEEMRKVYKEFKNELNKVYVGNVTEDEMRYIKS